MDEGGDVLVIGMSKTSVDGAKLFQSDRISDNPYAEL